MSLFVLLGDGRTTWRYITQVFPLLNAGHSEASDHAACSRGGEWWTLSVGTGTHHFPNLLGSPLPDLIWTFFKFGDFPT
jgi:hypothetical protein